MNLLHYLQTETLTVSDSKLCLKTLGIDAKSDEIQSFVLSAVSNRMTNSRNRDNKPDEEETVDKDSFLRFAAAKLIQIENAHKAFALIDKDEKGVVVMEDLRRVARELGEDFTEEELIEMIELVDRSSDGDGMLRARDFVRIARRVNL
jgi:Ca2+-binding EF-hand superfamily protein